MADLDYLLQGALGALEGFSSAYLPYKRLETEDILTRRREERKNEFERAKEQRARAFETGQADIKFGREKELETFKAGLRPIEKVFTRDYTGRQIGEPIVGEAGEKISVTTLPEPSIEKKIKGVDIEKEKDKPKVRASLRGSLTELDRFESKVDELLGKPLSKATGALRTSFIPGSEGADIAADLDSIKALSAFTTLQEMRKNSPTGGALGQVSDRENQLLQDAAAALKQSQSETNLRKNLQSLKDKVRSSRNNLKTAYAEDYGEEFQESTGVKRPLKDFFR